MKSAVHLSLLFGWRLLAETKRWHRKSGEQTGAGPNPCRVFYGHEHLPARHEYAGGAMVKFQDLNDRFPNTVLSPSIVYLVSSALPLYPNMIARIAKQRGALLVLNQNGVAYPGWHGPGWQRTNRPARRLLQQADYVFYQSRFCKESADVFAGVCSAPHEILANPVDTHFFVPVVEPPPGLRILLAGSHQHWYRVRTALETIARLPQAHLTIAGRFAFHTDEGSCLEQVRGLANHLNISDRVTWTGPYSQEAAPQLFQSHHVLLHTKYNDPCPRLVVEAMSCGVPVVYSASGGVPELVGDEGGIGCVAPHDYLEDHPPDPVSLADAVEKVAMSLPRFARQARSRAERLFDVRPWLDRHEQVFSRLLAEKQRFSE